MKLPGANQNLGVQSLGRETGSQSHGALANLAGVAVQEINEYEERRDRHELATANAALTSGEADLRGQIDGRDNIDFDDLPSEMKPRYRGQSNVPMHEVGAEIYSIRVKKLMQTHGEGIRSKRVRDSWFESKAAVVAQSEADRVVKQRKQQIDYIRKDVVQQIGVYIEKGDTAAAGSMIDSSSELSEIEKKDLHRKVNKAQEIGLVIDAFRAAGSIDSETGEDAALATLRDLKTFYGSDNYSGALSRAEALQQLTRINTEITRLETKDEALRIATEAEMAVRRVIAEGGTYAERDKALTDSIKDVAVLTEARKRLKRAHERETAAKKQEKDDRDQKFLTEVQRRINAGDIDGAYAHLDLANASHTMLTTAHTMIKRSQEKRPRVTKDKSLYISVQDKIIRGEHVDLWKHTEDFSDLHMEHLVSMQGSRAAADAQQGTTTEIHELMGAWELGLPNKASSASKKEFNEITYRLQDSLQREATRVGRELNYKERRDVMERELGKVFTGDTAFWGSDKLEESFAAWLASSGFTSAQVDQAHKALIQSGGVAPEERYTDQIKYLLLNPGPAPAGGSGVR